MLIRFKSYSKLNLSLSNYQLIIYSAGKYYRSVTDVDGELNNTHVINRWNDSCKEIENTVTI